MVPSVEALAIVGGTMVREDFVFQGMKVWSSQFEYNAENKLLEEFICATGDVTNDSGIDFKCARISEKRFYDYTLGKLDHHGTEKLDEQGNVIFNESVTVNQDDRGNIISELYNNGPNTSQNHTYIYTDQDNIRKKRVAYLPGNTTEDITFEVDDGVNPFLSLMENLWVLPGTCERQNRFIAHVLPPKRDQGVRQQCAETGSGLYL